MKRNLVNGMRLHAWDLSILVSLPVGATTYYCDNDAAASQYPQCATLASKDATGWSYHSGQGGDWSWGDRRAPPTSPGGVRWAATRTAWMTPTLWCRVFLPKLHHTAQDPRGRHGAVTLPYLAEG